MLSYMDDILMQTVSVTNKNYFDKGRSDIITLKLILNNKSINAWLLGGSTMFPVQF